MLFYHIAFQSNQLVVTTYGVCSEPGMTQELMANVRLGGAERPARVADVVSAEEGPVRKPVEKFPRADESSQGGSKSVRADR